MTEEIQLGFDGFPKSKKAKPAKPKPIADLPDLDSFDYYLVSVSGGKDSQACANLAIQRWGKERVVLVHALVEPEETPMEELIWESVENIEHLKYLEDLWQMPIHRVNVLNTDSTGISKEASFVMPDAELKPYMGLTNIVLNRGYMPGGGFPFCTQSKSMAINRFASRYSNPIQIIGQRAEESLKRAKMPEYEHDVKYHRYIYRPIHKWSGKQVLDYLEALDQKLNPVYALGLTRGGQL